MPTINFIGKDKVSKYHQQVPYKVLNYVDEKSCGESKNKIIQGDNLEVLKSLLPEYQGKIKCIYIDPPYNTGNENWIYNDNVNDPKLQKWLGQVVGLEGEDFNRHDKWLCMMYPRLQLMQKLLSDDGAIFISIDDNELCYLKMICDEIFGKNNFVDIFSWRKTETPANLAKKTKKSIEYVICYTKTDIKIKFRGLKKVSKSSNGLMNQTNSEKELIFPANYVDTALPNGTYLKKEYGTPSYKIFLLEDTEVENGYFTKPVKLYGKFKWSQENLNKEISQGTKISIRTLAFSPSYEKKDYEPEVPPNIIDKSFGVQTNEQATAELKKIFDGEKVFDFPKPPSLIEYLINFICDSESIILDAFAGSGTTAHAVINLNNSDGGDRKFILIEQENYCDSITAERVRRINGKFNYYELGEEIFINGKINKNISIDQLRDFIYLSETGQHSTSNEKYYLGTFEDTAYYFYYEPDQQTCLDYEFFSTLKDQATYKVIYANTSTLGKKFQSKYNLKFKSIQDDIFAFNGLQRT
ncbi:MAG: site-specific DNA-methyltransferase [Selenomonadaceae bacterium]|nr:site-specific DNA-methyltransferase [Selenomonadaceae bacterium]